MSHRQSSSPCLVLPSKALKHATRPLRDDAHFFFVGECVLITVHTPRLSRLPQITQRVIRPVEACGLDALQTKWRKLMRKGKEAGAGLLEYAGNMWQSHNGRWQVRPAKVFKGRA